MVLSFLAATAAAAAVILLLLPDVYAGPPLKKSADVADKLFFFFSQRSSCKAKLWLCLFILIKAKKIPNYDLMGSNLSSVSTYHYWLVSIFLPVWSDPGEKCLDLCPLNLIVSSQTSLQQNKCHWSSNNLNVAVCLCVWRCTRPSECLSSQSACSTSKEIWHSQDSLLQAAAS